MENTKKPRPIEATMERETGSAAIVQADSEAQTDFNTPLEGLQDKLALRPRELAAVLGIGNNAAYTLIHRQDFPAVWIGRNCIIPVDGLRRWLDKQTEGAEKWKY